MRLIFIDEDGAAYEEVTVPDTVTPVDAGDPGAYPGDPE